MSKVSDLINAHLCPVLGTFAVVYGAIHLAPVANQARQYNTYAGGLITSFEKQGDIYSHHHIECRHLLTEAICKSRQECVQLLRLYLQI